MLAVNKKTTMLSIGVIILISFAILGILISNNIATAGEKPELSNRQSVYVSSLEEASELAGFDVAAPSDELIRFSTSELNYRIDVNQLVQLGTKPAPKFVGQSWELSDGSVVRLIQGIKMRLPGIGEPININGMNGERVFFAAESYLPNCVALYWTNGDMGYSLFGTLTDSINEDMLLSIAKSVMVR